MIFRKQLCDHNPPVSFGDCFRTVIGCLLDMEPQDVPHFMAMNGDDSEFVSPAQNDHIKNWLAEKGYAKIEFGFQCPGASPQDMRDYACKLNGPDFIYMLAGMSVIGSHVVICRGPDVLWDPSPFNSGIVSGIQDNYWISFLAPVSCVRYTPDEKVIDDVRVHDPDWCDDATSTGSSP